MVYSLLLFVNIRVILSKTYVVLVCGKYNTSVHRQEYSTKCYCWYCQLKLDYVCTSLHSPLSFRIDVRLEDNFYSHGCRLVAT